MRYARRIPKAAHAVDFVGREIHMGGQHVRKAADFSSAHSIGLAGQRQRAHPRFADPPRCEVAIDNGFDFIRALRGLIDALAPGCDCSFCCKPQIDEARNVCFGEAAFVCGGLQIGRNGARAGKGLIEAFCI